MSYRIWKWLLQITDRQTIKMPVGAQMISVTPLQQHESKFIVLYALVDPDRSYEEVTFDIFGTGNPIDAAPSGFIGTVCTHSGVWHVFKCGSGGVVELERALAEEREQTQIRANRVAELERMLERALESERRFSAEVEAAFHKHGLAAGPTALDRVVEERDKARAEVGQLTSERDALKAFKDFVHARLTQMGVLEHPNGEHSAAGCRIGDRLDIIEAERAELVALKARLEKITARCERISIGAPSKWLADACVKIAAGIEAADE